VIRSLDFIVTPERSRRTRFSFEEAPLAGMSMLSQREARREALQEGRRPRAKATEGSDKIRTEN